MSGEEAPEATEGDAAPEHGEGHGEDNGEGSGEERQEERAWYQRT